MSTNPDRLVTTLSQWLARHVGDEELKRELAEQPLDALEDGQRELLKELRAALEGDGRSRGDVEMLVREALEALALGTSNSA